MKVFAPAKVNLFLHVGPVKSNGRHDLQSLVVFADTQAADVLAFAKHSELSLKVTGEVPATIGDVSDNLVLKAARALAEAAGQPISGAFSLEKRLPVAAGIGGGSADAAAAMKLLQTAYDLPDVLVKSVAPPLGGDVPVALHGSAALMEGEGETIRPVHLPVNLPAVLVNPRIACPTGPIFKGFDDAGGGTKFALEILPEFKSFQGIIDYLSRCRNDLENSARKLVPDIQDVLDELSALPGQRLVRMSGSGATCFALFETLQDAKKAEEVIQKRHPDWWIKATVLS